MKSLIILLVSLVILGTISYFVYMTIMSIYDSVVNGNKPTTSGNPDRESGHTYNCNNSNIAKSSKPSRFTIDPKTNSLAFNIKERSHKNAIEGNQRFTFKLWQNGKINNMDNSERKLKLKEYSDKRKGWEIALSCAPMVQIKDGLKILNK